jgi:hypothetical protein
LCGEICTVSFFACISYLMCWEGEKFFRRDTFEQLSTH